LRFLELKDYSQNLTDIAMVERMVSTSGINTDLVPLVKLSTEILDEATKILNQISDILKDVDQEQNKPPAEMDFTKIQNYFDEMAVERFGQSLSFVAWLPYFKFHRNIN